MRRTHLSHTTREALTLLAESIRVGRIRRHWTVVQLAERVGVSPPTIVKVERGDAGVAVGTVLEAARLVGVPLFDTDDRAVARYSAHTRAELALLPTVVCPRAEVDDDF